MLVIYQLTHSSMIGINKGAIEKSMGYCGLKGTGISCVVDS